MASARPPAAAAMDGGRHEPPTSAEGYLPLQSLRVRPAMEGDGFTLCLWLYLSSSTPAPATVFGQICTGDGGDREAPFLRLNGDRSLSMFPVLSVHEGAERIMDTSSNPGSDSLCAIAGVGLSLGKWIHIGCEVARDYVRLHVDGVIVGEKFLSYLSTTVSKENNSQNLTLVGYDKSDEKLQGFFHHVRVLPLSSSVSDHRVESPPYELSVDTSSLSQNQDVEEGGDGVLNVVGGKASCRRNFSLDVVLIDALGQTVNKDMEVVASLVYADNGELVEKPKDATEAPLLFSNDGFEFPSSDRPVKLINGRASFKLKISQLSSKCDNRLFRICFSIFGNQMCPFLESCSRPIRCISRNRIIRSPSLIGKKAVHAANLFGGSHPSDVNEVTHDVQHAKLFNNGYMANQEVMHGCAFKRVKIGHDKISTRIYADSIVRCPDEIFHTDEKGANFEGLSYQPSRSDSCHAKKNTMKTEIPDITIFKYCLGGLQERTVLLKDVATSSKDPDILDFAQQVSLYIGCSHHRRGSINDEVFSPLTLAFAEEIVVIFLQGLCNGDHLRLSMSGDFSRDQILMARKLIQEGEETWTSISDSGHQVLWNNASEEIERRFLKITRSSRSLSKEDLEVLHQMAGPGDCIDREGFDRIWNWLYPVACALSTYEMNEIWECMSPKWIEGIIKKEEAEASLAGPCGLQAPGTFVLRFPTSRSWPHPDAGSLVVTYVGLDSTIHHKLLSLGGKRVAVRKTLQEELLSEPELSRLGRVARERYIFP